MLSSALNVDIEEGLALPSVYSGGNNDELYRRPPINTTDRHRLVESIIKRYRSKLFSYLRGKIPNEAEDILQDVFLKLFLLPHIAAIENPESYLFRMASNAANSHYKRILTKNDSSRFSEGAERRCDTECPEQILVAEQEFALLLKRHGGLPARCRMAYDLRLDHGKTNKMIAKEMEITESMVEKHLALARKTLKY